MHVNINIAVFCMKMSLSIKKKKKSSLSTLYLMALFWVLGVFFVWFCGVFFGGGVLFFVLFCFP